MMSSRDVEYGVECAQRLTCKIFCVLDNFPNFDCTVRENFEVTYGGNEYKKLYEFHLQHADFSQEGYSECRDTIPEPALTAAVEKKMLWDGTLPRTDVRLTLSKISS